MLSSKIHISKDWHKKYGLKKGTYMTSSIYRMVKIVLKHTHTHIYILASTNGLWLNTRDAGIETWLTSRQSNILPQLIVILSVNEGIVLGIYSYITLSAIRVLNSWGELCIYAYVVVGNFSLECSTHWEGIYIVIHRQIVLLYHNCLVWLDTRDASGIETQLTLRQSDINKSS